MASPAAQFCRRQVFGEVTPNDLSASLADLCLALMATASGNDPSPNPAISVVARAEALVGRTNAVAYLAKMLNQTKDRHGRS